MHRMLSVKLDDLNQFLTCPLCKGYLVDSYTVNECLHSCAYLSRYSFLTLTLLFQLFVSFASLQVVHHQVRAAQRVVSSLQNRDHEGQDQVLLEVSTISISVTKEQRVSFLLLSRRDLNLQYIVYKLVPDLFKSKLKVHSAARVQGHW